ncbi:MAG: alpha-(1-_3)-arabinofuranosyltransferase family protein, partial [Aquihabitans sp.]
MSVSVPELGAEVRPSSAADDEVPPPTVVDPTQPPPTGRREFALLFAGFVALAAAVIGTRWGVFTPDTRPDLYEQPGRFLSDAMQAWVGGATGLGQGNFNAGAAPVAVVVWVIRTLGSPAWLAVRIWRLLLLVLGAWGIRRYLGAVLGDRLTVTGRLVVTAFWVANPYVIVAGNTTPILLPYALLPWTMLAFVRATREPRSWRWPAVFALGFFAQTGLNAGVVPFFQLLALPAHIVWARWVEHRRMRDLMGTLVRCGVLSVMVSLYWLAPAFLASGTGASIASTTESPVDVARTSSYAETSRLLGAWPLYGRSGSRLFLGGYTAYLTNPFALLSSFLLPVAVGLAMWRSRSRERLLVVGLLAVAIPVMVGVFPPETPYTAGRALLAVFEAVPASLAFRTTNKVGAVVVLGYALALAIGVRSWQRSVHRSSPWVGQSGLAVAAVLVFGASLPMWNGSLYPLGYDVPDTWHQATADLDGHPERGRVLVVPGGTGGNYRWGMRSPDDLFPSHMQRQAVSRNTVVGRGDPSGNLLSWFDTALQQGVLAPEGTSTMARYLGA